MSQANWDRDDYQFPRLLSEILAVGLTDEQLKALSESMGLGLREIDSLFDRAEAAWEEVKKHTVPTLARTTELEACDRQFWKTVLAVTVLSEDEPLQQGLSLADIHYEVTEGHCSGAVDVVDAIRLTPKEAAEELRMQGSDPEFFRLTEDGEPLAE